MRVGSSPKRRMGRFTGLKHRAAPTTTIASLEHMDLHLKQGAHNIYIYIMNAFHLPGMLRVRETQHPTLAVNAGKNTCQN